MLTSLDLDGNSIWSFVWMLSGFPQVTCSSVNLTNQDHLNKSHLLQLKKTSRCFQITPTASAEFPIPCTKILVLWFNIHISGFTGKVQCSWKDSSAALTILSGACLFPSSTLYIYLTLLVYSTQMCEFWWNFLPKADTSLQECWLFPQTDALIYGSEELRNIRKHIVYQESTIELTLSQHALAQQKHIHIIYSK